MGVRSGDLVCSRDRWRAPVWELMHTWLITDFPHLLSHAVPSSFNFGPQGHWALPFPTHAGTDDALSALLGPIADRDAV